MVQENEVSEKNRPPSESEVTNLLRQGSVPNGCRFKVARGIKIKSKKQ